MYLVLSLILLLVFCIITALLAKRKGYNPLLWFFTGSIIGFLVLLFLPLINRSDLPKEEILKKVKVGNIVGGIIIAIGILFALAIIVYCIFCYHPIPKNAIPIEAVQADEVAAVEKALENGANINARYGSYYNNLTPLEVAVEHYAFRVARFLVEKGANINAPGVFALHSACDATKGYDLVEFLLKNGAEIERRNFAGQTPLMRAVNQGTYQRPEPVVELLIKNGAKVNAQDNEGRTPLMINAGSADTSLEVSRLLIKNGADINARSKNGETALHQAVKSGRRDIAELLLKNGADALAKNDAEETPYSLAQAQGDTEMMRLFE